MNKIILALLFITILTGCDKIQPIKETQNIQENQNIEKTNEEINENSEEDGVDLNYEIGLEEEELITKRFEILAQKYENHNDLMKSIQYEQFVEYIYEVFDKYKGLSKEESEYRNNYIFNVLIPKIVINNYVIDGRISEKEAELIIQSIKRNDLNTLEDKEEITQKFKTLFEETKYKPFIENINTNNYSKQEKLDLLLEDKSGAIYFILSNRYNWNKTGIGFKPSEMEADFMRYLDEKLENILKIVGISEEELTEYVYKKYQIDSLEGLAKNILSDFNDIVSKYSLEGKIPLDRYYRNDERDDIFIDRETVNNYINEISGGELLDFTADLEPLRLKIYLLSYFGRNRKDLNEDQGLWSSRTRSDFIDKKYGKGIQNTFRLSRYLPGEEVKIDLENKNIINN